MFHVHSKGFGNSAFCIFDAPFTWLFLKDGRPGIWFAETFSTYLISLNKNKTWSDSEKASTSFFPGKGCQQRWAPCPVQRTLQQVLPFLSDWIRPVWYVRVIICVTSAFCWDGDERSVKMQQRIESQNVPSSVWLNEHGAFVDYTSIANAPSKDFYQVFVTPKEVNR